jgi:hypothetical protein
MTKRKLIISHREKIKDVIKKECTVYRITVLRSQDGNFPKGVNRGIWNDSTSTGAGSDRIDCEITKQLEHTFFGET